MSASWKLPLERGRRLGPNLVGSSPDSPLEGDGFELPVPRCARPADSAVLAVPPDSVVSSSSWNGPLRSIGCQGRQLLGMPPPRLRSIGPISDEARKLLPIRRGTESSNPSPSSGESTNHRFLPDLTGSPTVS